MKEMFLSWLAPQASWIYSTSRGMTSIILSCVIPRHYAVANINQWVGQGFGFHDRLVFLSKSMGHTTVESTNYYDSIVPGSRKS